MCVCVCVCVCWAGFFLAFMLLSLWLLLLLLLLLFVVVVVVVVVDITHPPHSQRSPSHSHRSLFTHFFARIAHFTHIISPPSLGSSAVPSSEKCTENSSDTPFTSLILFTHIAHFSNFFFLSPLLLGIASTTKTRTDYFFLFFLSPLHPHCSLHSHIFFPLIAHIARFAHTPLHTTRSIHTHSPSSLTSLTSLMFFLSSLSLTVLA